MWKLYLRLTRRATRGRHTLHSRYRVGKYIRKITRTPALAIIRRLIIERNAVRVWQGKGLSDMEAMPTRHAVTRHNNGIPVFDILIDLRLERVKQ